MPDEANNSTYGLESTLWVYKTKMKTYVLKLIAQINVILRKQASLPSKMHQSDRLKPSNQGKEQVLWRVACCHHRPKYKYSVVVETIKSTHDLYFLLKSCEISPSYLLSIKVFITSTVTNIYDSEPVK